MSRVRVVLVLALLVCARSAWAQSDTTPPAPAQSPAGWLLPAGAYINWGTLTSAAGYGIRDNAGQMEFSDSGGSWTAFAAGAATNYWSRAATTVSLATAGDTVNFANSTVEFGTTGFLFLSGTTGQVLSSQTTTAGAIEGQVSSGVGLYGTASTSGTAARGDATNGTAVAANQNGTLTATNSVGALTVTRNGTLNGNDYTGFVVDVLDTSTGSGDLMRMRYGAVNELLLTHGGTMTLNGIINAGGNSYTGNITGGANVSAIYNGQLGIGNTPHSNVLMHVLDVDFTPGTGSTTAYGFVSYPHIHALDAGTFTRVTGGMFSPTIITPASHTLTDASSLYLDVPTLTDGGGGVISNAATFMIENAPTFSATVTNGPYAMLVKAGVSSFNASGGAIQLPNITATTGTALVIDGSNAIRTLTSSARYKDHIQPWHLDQAALRRFVQLSPVQWDYIGQANGALGFLAEDLASLGIQNAYGVSPLVNYDTNGRPESNRDFSVIALQHLVIQDLTARLEQLERDVAQLHAKSPRRRHHR